MPRRILLIHGISKIGGAEKDLLRFLERIDRNLFELFVICPRNGPLFSELEQLKISVYPMNLPSWRKFKTVFSILPAVWSLFKLIKDLQIDLVHVNDFWWVPITYMASRMAHVPCIAHIRSQIEPNRVGQYWLRKPHRLVTVAHQIKTIAVESGVDSARISVVYSGIDTALTVNPLEGSRVRERYKLSPSLTVIGTVANFLPLKGYEYLIEALTKISRERSNIHCLLVGGGDDRYRAILEDRVRAKDLTQIVTFTGFQREIFAYITAMDIFVLPSLLEGFPIVILEALKMGKPVVATAVGGIPEIIENNVTGLLVPPRDPTALAHKILYLLENPKIGRELGQAGQARVLERFSAQRMVTQLQSLYEELLADTCTNVGDCAKNRHVSGE